MRRKGLRRVAACVFAAGMLAPVAAQATDFDGALVGRQSDGSVVIPTNQRLRPAGTQIELTGRPVAAAIRPDQRTAALLNGYGRALLVLDLATDTVLQEFTTAGGSASFGGLLYSADGNTLYASQASGRIVVCTVGADGKLTLARYINTPASTIPWPGREDNDAYPGGMAFSSDGTKLYVTLNRNNTLGLIDLATSTFVAQIPVGNAPVAVVVDGARAYVANRGGRPARPGDTTVDSSGTPIVADAQAGFSTTGTVSVVDLAAGRETATWNVGLQPAALLQLGKRLFVANANSDTVSIIDVATGTVKGLDVATARIGSSSLRGPSPDFALGAQPNALAFVDGKLWVTLPRLNALAAFALDVPKAGQAQFLGLVPTGWYPSSIVADATRGRLLVANAKGVGSLGPDAKTGPDPSTNRTGRYVHSNKGSVSLIAYPSAAQLATYTRTVVDNNGWLDGTWARLAGGASVAPRAASGPTPIPYRTGDPSVFKHVVYVVKENRTFDQLFGDLAGANADPNMLQFGERVTPNQHALARQFGVFDNCYDSGSLSADGHQWSTQAFAPDYLETAFGGFIRSYPFNAGDALAYTPNGFIFTNALDHGRSVRVWGEYVNGLKADGVEMGPWLSGPGHGQTEAGHWSDFWNDTKILAGQVQGTPHVRLEAHSDIPALDQIIDRAYPPYHQIINDQYRVEVWLKAFRNYVANGDMPQLSILCLTSDHTNGVSSNYPTPAAMVADNDLALGRVVEAISKSPYWKDTVIFVVEDDAQNGVDHVDGHRQPAFVISAYNKPNQVISRLHSQVTFIRSMEQILGLPPMNTMDAAVDPTSLGELFADHAVQPAFDVRPTNIPLDTMSFAASTLTGIERAWAEASDAMDFSHPDAADEELLNRAIWYATKGYETPYPGDSRPLWPEEVHSYLDARER